ncbi:invasion associated locus B family protein [Ruegeria sp. ANG10]|uniref:invasion associated locus B family protein n=1 Tax=Ruegeria sp. ANG10 TaxID=3042467 RepID=UPI003454C283
MLRLFFIVAAFTMVAEQGVANPKKVASAGDWSIYCDPSASVCAARQNVAYRGKNIASVFSHPIDGREAVAAVVLRLPTTVNLKKGVDIRIDGKSGLHYEFHFCAPEFCQVSIGLTQKTLNSYKKGTTGEVIYFFAGSPTVQRSFEFSLYGFSAAFEEVRKRGYPKL